MTFKECEQGLPNGFHDSKIEQVLLDYPKRTLQLTMSILVGTPGDSHPDDYKPAELRIDGLYFCSIEPPDPKYPFARDGRPIRVSGDSSCGGAPEITNLTEDLPPGVSCYRFFVEPWNSFIYIAASDVQILWK